MLAGDLRFTVVPENGTSVRAKWTTAGNIAGLYSDRQFSPCWDNGSGGGGDAAARFSHIQYTHSKVVPLLPLFFSHYPIYRFIGVDCRQVQFSTSCHLTSFGTIWRLLFLVRQGKFNVSLILLFYSHVGWTYIFFSSTKLWRKFFEKRKN